MILTNENDNMPYELSFSVDPSSNRHLYVINDSNIKGNFDNLESSRDHQGKKYLFI